MAVEASKRAHPTAPKIAGELPRNLLSQELSFLDYDARVLELAAGSRLDVIAAISGG